MKLIVLFLFLCLALTGSKGSNVDMTNYYQLELPSVVGPESIAFDCNGKGPYVGVSDGRILRWDHGWKQFAITSPNRKAKECDGANDTKSEPICGRPLGLKFNPSTCDLYIADAYFGLLKVGQKGGVATQLATAADGVPFRFTNALDIDHKTGLVYFTDSSTMFQRRQIIMMIIGGDRTGRVMKYDPESKNTSVLLSGLAMANGVALSKDKSFILVAETTKRHVLKYWLKGSKSHTYEVFAKFQGWPDNVKMNKEGGFWVAINTGRALVSNQTVFAESVRDTVAIKFDEKGNAATAIDGNNGDTFESVSEVEEYGGNLWIGSSVKPYLGVLKV